MHHIQFSRGPIKLFPLPGTEDYVKKVSRWMAKHCLADINRNNFDIAEFFYMNEDEEAQLKNNQSNEEELVNFLSDFLIGDFNYFCHRNGAIEISINSSVRRKDIYVFHTFSEAQITDYNGVEKTLNLSDQELLLYNTLDAFLEAKVDKVSIFENNLGQARSDRPKGRGSCNLRTFFRNICANKASHLFTYQIHSSKSLIGIDNTKITYDNLSGENLLKKYILRNHIGTVKNFNTKVHDEWIFSSVDAGGKEFAAKFAKSFKVPLLVVDKRRNTLTNKVEEVTILKPESLSLEGKTIFIVDDMIDSGGSIVDVCRRYKELGAKEINIAIIFGLFSPPAEERLNKLREEGALNKLIVTDLITLDDDFIKRNPYIEIADTTYTSARIVQRTNRGISLEKYFLPIDAEDYLRTKVELKKSQYDFQN